MNLIHMVVSRLTIETASDFFLEISVVRTSVIVSVSNTAPWKVFEGLHCS